MTFDEELYAKAWGHWFDDDVQREDGTVEPLPHRFGPVRQPRHRAPLPAEPWMRAVPSPEAYAAAVARLLDTPRIADRLQQNSRTAWITLWHARDSGSDVHRSGWMVRYRKGTGVGPALLWEVGHESGPPQLVKEYERHAVEGWGRMPVSERWQAPGGAVGPGRTLRITKAPDASQAHLATLTAFCACRRRHFELPIDKLTNAIVAEQSRATPRDRDHRLFVNVPLT